MNINIVFVIATVAMAQEVKQGTDLVNCWEEEPVKNPQRCLVDARSNLNDWKHRNTKTKDEKREKREQIKVWEGIVKRLQHQPMPDDSPQDLEVKRLAEQIRLRREIAEKEKELKNISPPTEEMKQARKQIRHVEDEAERRRRAEARAEADAIRKTQAVGLTGCPAGTVSFNPSIAGRWTGFGSQHVKIVIVNMRNIPIDIRMDEPNGSGDVIRNLCPGGRITFTRSYFPFVDPQWVNGMLSAFPAMNGYTQTMPYSLSGSSQGTYVQTWEIR